MHCAHSWGKNNCRWKIYQNWQQEAGNDYSALFDDNVQKRPGNQVANCQTELYRTQSDKNHILHSSAFSALANIDA